MTILKSEVLKLVTSRATFALGVLAAGLTVVMSLGLVAQAPPPWHVTSDLVRALGPVNAPTLGLFAMILGIRAYTEEFRYGTIAHTAMSDPAQLRTMAAKAAVAGAAGALMVGVSVVTTWAAMVGMTGLGGGSLDASGAVIPMLGMVLAGALWGAVGVGIGAIVRLPIPAIVVAIFWVAVIESLAGTLTGSATLVLPGQAAQALAGGAGGVTGLLGAFGVMVAWAGTMALLGWRMLRRRDLM